MTSLATSLEWQCHNWKSTDFSRVDFTLFPSIPPFRYTHLLNVSSATVGGRIPSKEHKGCKLRRDIFFVVASQILEKAFGQNWPCPVPGRFNSAHDGQPWTRGMKLATWQRVDKQHPYQSFGDLTCWMSPQLAAEVNGMPADDAQHRRCVLTVLHLLMR